MTATIRKLVPAPLKRWIAEQVQPRPDAPVPPSPRDLQSEMTCIGAGVRVDPSVVIDYAQGLCLGNDVTIGADVNIDAQGGVMIASGVTIADGATIASSLPLPVCARDPHLPEERAWGEVFIGEHVHVGANACILPGVTIGANATIAPHALVDADVPAGTHFGFSKAKEPLTAMIRLASDGEASLPPTDPTGARPATGREQTPDICFVASTGRSGSTTIASLLSRHPGIVAKHEPRHQIIKLSTDYAHGLKTRDEVKASLERLLLDGSVYHGDRIHLESDLKYFNLVPILAEIFPNARFVWLVRSGYDVVSSTHGRSWFADSSHPVWREIYWFFNKHRVQGDKTGAMPAADWAAMSAFQRNCWYWTYVNETIERDFAALPEDRKMFLRLEDIDARIDELVAFLGAAPAELTAARTNEAFYAKTSPENWTEDQKKDFERLCGPLMKRLYE